MYNIYIMKEAKGTDLDCEKWTGMYLQRVFLSISLAWWTLDSWEPEVLHLHLLATAATMANAEMWLGWKALIQISQLFPSPLELLIWKNGKKKKWKVFLCPLFPGKWCPALVFTVIWITSTVLLRNSTVILRNNLVLHCWSGWAAEIAQSAPLSFRLKEEGVSCVQ